MAGSASVQWGNAFHADGPSCENACSLNFEHGHATVKFIDDVDRMLEHEGLALTDSTKFVRQAGRAVAHWVLDGAKFEPDVPTSM